MWKFKDFIPSFKKKNFALPLSSRKPLIAVIQGKISYFDPLDNENRADKWLIEKYNTLSEVAAPFNKYGDYASVVKPELFNKKGEELPFNHRAYLLIKRPNSNQNWQEFYKKHIIYRLLLGQSYVNAFGYISKSLGFDLKLLPPQYTTIELKNKNDWRNIEIDYYSVKVPYWNEIKINDLKTVLHVKNTSPSFGKNADLYGQSKLLSCIKNIESIESGYGAKVGLYKHGPRVVMTGKQLGEFAAANAQSNETVKEVQNRINNEYGLQENQYSVMITDIPLDVNVVSMDMGQLKINENNISDFQAICRALDIDSRVLSDVSSSTFNNVEMAFQSFLNGSFKILIENDYAQWSAWLSQLFGEEIEMKPCFENIPEIVKKENENNDKLIQMAKDGLLTRNEVLERTGEEPNPDPEYDKLYTFNPTNSQWNPVSVEKDTETGISQEQMQAQANLRGTVGGVEGILSIQNSVSQGITDYEAGVAILVEIYGFTEEVARRVLGTPIVSSTANQEQTQTSNQQDNNNTEENGTGETE